jgi:hypothetical protein
MGSLVSGPYSGKTIQLDHHLFCPNPFTDPGEDKPPPNYTRKWAVSPDELSK